jgi:P-type Cu2+ transporter
MPVTEERAGTTTATTTGPECAHCGAPVPLALIEQNAPRQFCCAGCRTVWTVLHDSGLDGYYAIRRDAAEPGRAAEPSGRSYAELDDAGFQGRACRPTLDGLLATELYLEGVHCRACVWLVERLPRLLPGLVDVRLDLPRSRASLAWDPRLTTLSAVARLLDRVGYRPHPLRGLRALDARRREDRAMLARIGLAGAVAANVMGIAFALYGGMLSGMEPEFEGLFRWASLVITVPSFVWGGGVFFRGAWAALRVRTLHLDLPISIGLLAGFLHGATGTVLGTGDVYFDAVATLIFLLLLGRYLQRRQQRAAADAAELLASLAPSSARLVDGDGVHEVPIETLTPGARVEVRAGDTVPADGVVVGGRSTLDVSWLSGESRPAEAGRGDRVHAGTLNLSGRLEVLVEATGEDTRVGRLMALVDEHTRRRAPIVQLADRISGHFVAAVLVLAGITFALWAPLDPSRAIDHAVALLIVTCPCALGLATPLAVSAAIGQAARAGLLVKGADVIEKLTHPGRLWLDKTGTLTSGRFTLVDWAGDDSVKPLAASVETASSHPVARALVAALGPMAPAAAGAVEVTGRGVAGQVAGRSVVVGSAAFVAGIAGPIPPALSAAVNRFALDGGTPVVVAVDGVARAVAGLGDPLRPDAAGALGRLGRLGWRLGILSGDDPRVVAGAARRLGLDPGEARGGVTPEEKLRAVRAALAQGPVVMVGDGVNDSAALAAASVGIAVHGGAEAALAAADVFVTRPGVAPIAELVEGARRTMRVVRRNLALSLLYNVVGVVLAMTGVLNPLAAAILMPLSSLTVIASSYRARTFAAARPRP